MYLQFSVALSSIQYAISYSLPSSFTFPLLNSNKSMLSESNNVTNAYLYRSEPFLPLNIFLVVNSASYWVNMSSNLGTLKNASQKFPQCHRLFSNIFLSMSNRNLLSGIETVSKVLTPRVFIIQTQNTFR